MPKNPLFTEQVQFNPNNATDPSESGGFTYKSGTGFRMNVAGTVYTVPTSSSAGASTALDNLAAVAINTSLVSDTDSTDDLGSSAKYWANSYVDKMYVNGTATIDGTVAGTLTMTGAATLSGDLTIGSSKLIVTAASGNTTIAGTLTVSDDVAVNVDNKVLAFGASGIADSYMKFDGSSLVFFDATYGGEITLSQLTSIAPSPTITGDVTISDGKLDWTDAADEVAATWTLANTTNNGINIVSSATSGNVVQATANSLTSGSIFYAISSVAGLTTGNYFAAYDGAGVCFEVGAYGAITVAGNASTDVLTITAGDMQITAGDIDIDLGRITIDNTADEGNTIKRNNATGTAAVLEIEQTHATGGVALLVDQDATGDVNAQEITNAGTGFAVTTTGAAAGSQGYEFIAAASATGNGLLLDGTTGSWVGAATTGLAQITSDGTLASASASLVRISKTGETAASATGSSLAIVDASTGGATSGYAVYLNVSGALEALHVDAGKVQFDEDLTLSVDATGADLFVYSGTAGAYVHADSSEHEFRLAGTEIFAIGGTAGAKDGLTIDFDGADIDIDAVTANDNIKFGSDVDTNIIFATAASSLTIDHGANTVTMASGGYLACTGNGTGTGLAIPFHATNSPSDTVQGSIFFEVDANKLWVYNGVGWVGTTLA